MTQYIQKLPAVFQTVTEKKFFDATFDQVFSKKDSSLLHGYIGRRVGGAYNPVNDFYIPEPNKDRTWRQLEATAFARNEDTTKTNVLFYDDLLARINYYGGNTLNQDRLFNSGYYSWAPPIDVDMFTNYHNYFWIDTGLPVVTISGVLSSDITGQLGYTTPSTATPPNLTLTTGMKIVLSDESTDVYTVENIGDCVGIRLVPQFSDVTPGTILEFLPWDGVSELANGRVINNTKWDAITWDAQVQPGNADYITIERGSLDRNAWSRTNKWFHIDAINAAVAAVGAPYPVNASRALRPIIQFTADLTLYKSGSVFRLNIDYGLGNNQYGNPYLLSDYQSQQISTINDELNIEIINGDLICFFNDTTISGPETVNKFIYQAIINIDNTVDFILYPGWPTAVLDGDIVYVNKSAPNMSAQQSQSWYYANNVWQEVFNTKISTNQPPLFQLFDYEGEPLDSATKYPMSTFNGSKIFSYKVNTASGAFTDPVLKFPIVYTSLGQASDIIFQNNLITDRYVYNVDGLPITGYYNYTVTDNIVLHNNWNLHTLDLCETNPGEQNTISKQRVVDRYAVGYGVQFQFSLSVIPVGYVLGAGTVQLSADIHVSVNGIDLKNEPNGFTFIENNNTVYVDLTSYIESLLLTAPSQPPVVEIFTYTHNLLDPASTGYYEIPQQLEANPNQLEVTEISGSNLSLHFASIIHNQLNVIGESFGTNNYRDTIKNRSVGTYILQNITPLLKAMLVSSSADLDVVSAIRFSQSEYTKFKNKYLKTALQLINQGFDPAQFSSNTIVISEWVEEILKVVNISGEFSKSFAYSYMIASGGAFATEAHIVPVSGIITLTNYIDLSNLENSLYIYDKSGQETLLTVGVDYEIVSSNLLIIIQLNTSTVPVSNEIHVALYKNPPPTYIPATPSKLGTYPVFVPRVVLDTSYAIPAYVIVGHDGSKTILNGVNDPATGGYDPSTKEFSDYRDALLLELETRIYNLIQYKFRNQYCVPLRIESVKSGYFRATRYTRDEYLDITEPYLNKWTAANRANYRINDWAITFQSTPDDQLWKLYNYSSAIVGLTPLPGAAAYFMPGHWKGIFQYYYDTINPDTCPWEMLGFSEQPEWWVVQYGTDWSSLNVALWADLEAGIIRQGPSAVYDPITMIPQAQSMWARPGLLNIIPVDGTGNIIPVPVLFDINVVELDAPFDHFDDNWTYGDGAPVEQAWMSTSGYAYSVQEFLYLMRPASFGELLWDTLGTEITSSIAVPGMSSINGQYVQNEIYTSDDPLFTWMRPRNDTCVVHGETVDNAVQLRFGYQQWISDRLLFLGKDVTTDFGQLVRTLDVNLANKLAGFTNKDTTTTYIESVTPGMSSTNLLIPSVNFEVILHTGQPVKTYSYSGVIVRALSNGEFVVYGYDLLNSEFIVLDRAESRLIDITVGGTPAEYMHYTKGQTYNYGDIVRYNGVYYESLAVQLVDTFIPSNWQKLNTLPTVGGVSVSYKPNSAETTTRVPYGTVMSSAQEVFDLLIGWGAYLETQGWVFDEVSQETNLISDWLYSGKQFLFWLNTSWAPDAAIQLSPSANLAKLTVKTGYPNAVESLSNGMYSILDKAGVAMHPNSTETDRVGQLIQVTPTDTNSSGIYFLQVNSSETEHILMFDNSTSFGDVIYDPLLRVRQSRLRFNGFRSNGWYGKMEAPGYIVIDNQLVPNYDSIVDAMRHYYDPDIAIDNTSLEDLGRHLIGYESKSYLENLQVTDDVQYMFYQGAIRQKGTIQSFDKLFRSSKVSGNETIEVYEEWALKLGNFGNTVEQVSTEFILKPEQHSGEVVVARLNYMPSTVGFVKQINILNAENVYQSVPLLTITPPDADVNDINLTGPLRMARAHVILDTAGRISRVDITDNGYGYTTSPSIYINVGTASSGADRLYAVWQGEIINDTESNNIIDIDVDDTALWTVRPTDPEFSLEFPVTDVIDYPLPHAGYTNFNDIKWATFDNNELFIRCGSLSLNPAENDTIWVAKTFTNDWGVYKIVDIAQQFSISKESDGNLLLATPKSYLIVSQLSTIDPSSGNSTDFGNLISLQVNESQAVATVVDGVIDSVEITKTGAGYITAPIVTITDSTGINATLTAKIAGGIVTEILITNAGSGYVDPVITIEAPAFINAATNYVVGFEFSSADDNYNYYNLLSLDGALLNDSDLPDYLNFTKLMLFKTMRFYTEPSSVPTYILNNDKVWVDNLNGKWAVREFINDAFITHRIQEPLINTSLFKSARIFDNTTHRELALLPVYDPFKNILPALAKQNISWVSSTDPTRYNVTGDPRLYSANIAFGEAQVGKLWWDLANIRYVYYEQPMALNGGETLTENLVYRRDRWGQIFPGSSVDVFEWTKSPVPPSEYTGSGSPRSTTDYVQIDTSNRFTNITQTNYYFWVANTTTQPNIENRTLAALDVAKLLKSPRSQKVAFFAPIQQSDHNNSYMFYNVQDILLWKGNNVQVQYRLADREDQEHTQWKFFREGDVASLVTDQFWNKLVDSLCGYTKLLPASSEWNGIVIAANLPWDIYGWDIAAWDDVVADTSPIYGEILPVPDPMLSEAEKYGVAYRPRQGMFVDIYAARKIFVQACNALLQYIPIKEIDPLWAADVTTDAFWEYTTWYKLGFENVKPTLTFATIDLAQTALDNNLINVGTIIQVVAGTTDNRYALYNIEQVNTSVQTLSMELVAIESSAIKLLDAIYTIQNMYALATELRQLLGAFRDKVFINDYSVNQNELYFSLLNYVLSEQKNPDWVFKTSYIYIKENNIQLKKDALYIPNQINNIVDYINDIKPYHTQIRDYTSTYLVSDIANGTAEDWFKWSMQLQFGPSYHGLSYTLPYVTLDPMIGYDLDQGPYNGPWDSQDINVLTHMWDPALDIANVLDQVVSSDSEEHISVPLEEWAWVGDHYSSLYRYKLDFNGININNPQSFITPSDIVGIRVGSTILIQKQDYLVEYNNDTTYTVYFYNAPTETPIALVWFNGGNLLAMYNAVDRDEVAKGTALDNLVINVDTKLPVNMISGEYSAISDMWDFHDNTIESIVTDLNNGAPGDPTPGLGWDNGMWNQTTTEYIVLADNYISSKENLNVDTGADFYRNADVYAGVLVYDLSEPDAATENLDVITVFASDDILPDPAGGHETIWINGERIQYRLKIQLTATTWELRLIQRGTNGTAPVLHTASTKVWVESNNRLTETANNVVWNRINSDPNDTSVPLGGLWYAQTTEAVFLKQGQGISIV